MQQTKDIEREENGEGNGKVEFQKNDSNVWLLLLLSLSMMMLMLLATSFLEVDLRGLGLHRPRRGPTTAPDAKSFLGIFFSLFCRLGLARLRCRLWRRWGVGVFVVVPRSVLCVRRGTGSLLLVDGVSAFRWFE